MRCSCTQKRACWLYLYPYALYSRAQLPTSAVLWVSSSTWAAQDARLILTAPEPALAECLIPPSAALAYEAHVRSSEAGASAASWDLAAAQPRVCAQLVLPSGALPARVC